MPADPPQKPKPSSGPGGCGCLLILLVAIAGGSIVGYQSLQESDQLSHNETVEIKFKGDWIEGETRTCGGVQTQQTARVWKLETLYCPINIDGESGHSVSIKFYGKTERSNESLADVVSDDKNQWRCVRRSGDFTCYALN